MLNVDESPSVQSSQERILSAARAELADYGGMLNLLNQQQETILNPDPVTEAVVALAIKEQQTILRTRRSQRESMISTLTSNGKAHPTLIQTILLFPQPMRPLVEALAAEVNRLIIKVRRREQQNQSLLERTLRAKQER